MLNRFFAALFCLMPTLGFAQEKPSAILVLDASGSMWGQIDGTAKITIAQDVIGQLLQSLPADQQLGLTVYGHRRKGDCSDIETLIQPGGDTRAAILSAVNAISPKGKTPLSAAVIQAAESLRYTEEKATVILVSDGRETCELDPCAVGRDLEAAGIDFTAHVIGFDISDAKDRAELQCLAEETGGTFRTASNADELGEALQVIAEPAPEPTKVTFLVIEGKNGPVITDQVMWWLGAKDEILIDNIPHDNKFTMEFLPGTTGRVEVLRAEDEAVTEAEFMVSESPMTITLVLPVVIPPATLIAPETAVAGSDISIEWTGPNADRDHITVAEIGSGGTTYIAFAYSKNGNPSVIKMPLKPGKYQLRYVLNEGRKILARRDITITPVTASLNAPDVVSAGDTVAVEWDGPNYKGDYISLAPAGSKIHEYQSFKYTRDGSPAELRVPTVVGKYVLRYLAAGPDQMALTTRDITVEAVKATLEFTPSIAAGSTMPVAWTGPNSKNDYIAIAVVGSKVSDEVTYSYLKNGAADSVDISVPTTAGTYEVRYIQSGSDKVILAAETLVVEPIMATLQYMNPAPAGTALKVEWSGPNSENDYIAIAEVGSKVSAEITYSYLKNSDGNALEIAVPTKPGTYEIRYIQNGTPKAIILAEQLIVEPVAATLAYQNPAPAGTALMIEWSGPNSENDYIAIAEVGSKVSAEITYSYLKNSDANALEITVPTKPGTYEIRYIQNGTPKTILLAEQLVVEPVTATLEFITPAPMGAKLQVTWTGPNSSNDYLEITEQGSKIGDEISYAYVKNSDGDSISLKLPTKPGTYEVRYIQNGTPKVMITAETLVVEPIQVTLEANTTVAPAGNLVVTWQGPAYERDYIAISRVGDSGYEVYVYTRDGSPMIIKAPDLPGEYELRYVLGQNEVVMARQPLSIN